MVRMGLTDRELSTILAALRHWQRGGCCDLQIQDIAANTLSDRPCTPLDEREIDDLCEALNCGALVPTMDVRESELPHSSAR